jgi:hypothetical protein
MTTVINNIKDFLSSPKNGIYIIIGPSQSRKTTIALSHLEQYSYLDVPYETFNNNIDLKNTIGTFINLKRITHNGNTINTSNIIFIDDVDILISQNRQASNIIIGFSKTCKILATCTNSGERKLTELKKQCKPENIMRLDLDKELKEGDMNIYQIVKTIFDNDHKPINDVEIAISSDSTLVGFIMYDNYKTYFEKYKQIPLDIHNKISRVFLESTLIEDYGFLTNDHYIVDVANIIRCCYIRNIQKQMVYNDKKKKTDGHPIVYTQIMARSVQYCNINKKHAHMDNMNTSNIMLYSMISHQYKLKPDLKTDLGSLCQSYIFNICKKIK